MDARDPRIGGLVGEVIAEATGRAHRDDTVLAGTGGPAGNAALTAWTGLVLLVLGVAELLTLFDVRGLISWHVAVGALLVPTAAVKTASTGWRVVGYYRRNPGYVQAGPPQVVMRVLGPVVVISTLALLGSGVLLILLGEQSARQVIVTVLGFRIDWITVHQTAFVAWATATGLHVLGRLVRALQLTVLPTILSGAGQRARLPGRLARAFAFGVAAVAAVVLALVLVRAEGTWTG